MMAGVTIEVLANGPLLVKGAVALTDAAGNELVPPKQPVALCRCGSSKKKPFCDGSHGPAGFRG